MLPEDLTEIVLVARRLCSTTGDERDGQRDHETLQPQHTSHCRLRGVPLQTFRIDAPEQRVT
jgi:hypothetical protein